jgi:hypothetical protein
MNPNYVVVVKQDLNNLLTTRFVVVMEEVTWLSLIVVVPKEMVSCAFASISGYYMQPQKEIHIPYHLQKSFWIW